MAYQHTPDSAPTQWEVWLRCPKTCWNDNKCSGSDLKGIATVLMYGLIILVVYVAIIAVIMAVGGGFAAEGAYLLGMCNGARECIFTGLIVFFFIIAICIFGFAVCMIIIKMCVGCFTCCRTYYEKTKEGMVSPPAKAGPDDV